MSTTAAECAGDVAIITLSETMLKVVAASVPNLTLVAVRKLVPFIVTTVPPAEDPLVGEMLTMVGTGSL
jgi:hypothetical protein